MSERALVEDVLDAGILEGLVCGFREGMHGTSAIPAPNQSNLTFLLKAEASVKLRYMTF
jgi:hypothetical protein